MMRISYILLIIACFSFQVSAEVSYRLFPQPIILEKDDAGQYLNFDVLLKNKNKLNINITYIEFVIYDKNGRDLPNNFLLLFPYQQIHLSQLTHLCPTFYKSTT